MTEQEAKEIIVNENLRRFNWFGEQPNRENEIVI